MLLQKLRYFGRFSTLEGLFDAEVTDRAQSMYVVNWSEWRGVLTVTHRVRFVVTNTKRM